MTQEEKAKAYDKAITHARALLKTIGNATLGNLVLKNEFERMFPELAESEDDKLKEQVVYAINQLHVCECTKNKLITWLEKQCEQKSIDKVEPKFKAGDIIINKENGAISKVNKILPYDYELISFGTGKHLILDQNLINGNSKLWTIQDAKDGDVLACENGWTCIFKDLDNHTNTFSSYCFMDKDKWFCNTGSECHTLDKAFIKAYNEEIYPAAKKQRDLLFQKMKEAGYEWDAEKKELKKIEQKPWSEEDENYYRRMVISIQWARAYNRITDDSCDNQLTWFKSLRDRVSPQPRQEWSEEDERTYESILYAFEHRFPLNCEQQKFVKSLRPQSQWKPSDKQMEVLNTISNKKILSGYESGMLIGLYTELQKLREE